MTLEKKETQDADIEAALEKIFSERVDGFRRILSCRRLSGGASQETYRICIATESGEQQLAMRRGPAGMHKPAIEGGPGLAVEAKLMRLAREAGVPEPRILYVAAPEDGLGEAFIMEWLEGETLGARIVRSEALAAIRPRLAYQCGQILARIHAIEVRKNGLDKVLRALDAESMVELAWSNYKSLQTPQPMFDFTARWLKDHLPHNARMTLVHNDFRNGNLIISPKGVVGVLDWELAIIGDPMRDLGWICTNSWRFGESGLPVGGFGVREDLFRGYEEESGRKVDLAHVKFWEVFGSLWWGVICLLMAEHYRSGPDKTVERPAIGRRSSECQVDCVNLLIPGPFALIEAGPTPQTSELPRIDELISSVRDFLRSDVMGQTQGRTNFLARVASNSLDIVLRDTLMGEKHRRLEKERLRRLLHQEGDLESLRWILVRKLRDGTLPLDHRDLDIHLRTTVLNQAAIDQPNYSGCQAAMEKVLEGGAHVDHQTAG